MADVIFMTLLRKLTLSREKSHLGLCANFVKNLCLSHSVRRMYLEAELVCWFVTQVEEWNLGQDDGSAIHSVRGSLLHVY